MKPYFYEGKFSSQLTQHVLSNAGAFEKTMRASVEAFGGKLINCFSLAESLDPIGFVEFPKDVQARAWAAFYGSQEGVLSSKIKRLLDMQDLAQMHKMIESNKEAATAHRKT